MILDAPRLEWEANADGKRELALPGMFSEFKVERSGDLRTWIVAEDFPEGTLGGSFHLPESERAGFWRIQGVLEDRL